MALKYSMQRRIILDTILNNPIHPTADEVYNAVRERLPSISLGTVYRNLNLLCELGELRKIPISIGSDRFDGRTDEHFHAICQKCGKVYDLDIPELFALSSIIKKENNFTPSFLELTVVGVCGECTKKNEEAKANIF